MLCCANLVQKELGVTPCSGSALLGVPKLVGKSYGGLPSPNAAITVHTPTAFNFVPVMCGEPSKLTNLKLHYAMLRCHVRILCHELEDDLQL